MRWYRISRCRLKRRSSIMVFCISNACICFAQNTTVLPFFSASQDESTPGQEASSGISSGNMVPFDQKPRPGRGPVGGFADVDVLEVFRPLFTVQEQVFQKAFFLTKHTSGSGLSVWSPAIRTLMVGWLDRTYYHTESPEFSRENEKQRHLRSEIIITEMPIKNNNDKQVNTGGGDTGYNEKKGRDRHVIQTRSREKAGQPGRSTPRGYATAYLSW